MAVAANAATLASSIRAGPSPRPSQASPWVSNGTAGKKRSDWRPSGPYPWRAMVSYQPASHPSSPACTRAATPTVAGCVRSTMKWASPRAPSTTARATA